MTNELPAGPVAAPLAQDDAELCAKLRALHLRALHSSFVARPIPSAVRAAARIEALSARIKELESAPLPDEVRRVLGELAGAASLCWLPRPTGEFDAGAACKFVADAEAALRKLSPAVPPRNQNDNEIIAVTDSTSTNPRNQQNAAALSPAHVPAAEHANGDCPIGALHCPICSELIRNKYAANFATATPPATLGAPLELAPSVPADEIWFRADPTHHKNMDGIISVLREAGWALSQHAIAAVLDAASSVGDAEQGATQGEVLVQITNWKGAFELLQRTYLKAEARIRELEPDARRYRKARTLPLMRISGRIAPVRPDKFDAMIDLEIASSSPPEAP